MQSAVVPVQEVNQVQAQDVLVAQFTNGVHLEEQFAVERTSHKLAIAELQGQEQEQKNQAVQ